MIDNKEVRQDSQPFYDGIIKGEVRYKYCVKCSKGLPYSAVVCGRCGGGDIVWKKSEGKGRLISYVIYHRSFSDTHPAPYCVALMELMEGPRLLGMIGMDEVEKLKYGVALSASIRDGNLWYQLI